MINFRHTASLLTMLIGLSLTACNSSDGSSNPLTAGAQINFPPDGALIDGDTLTAIGTASDRDDVDSLRVNGIEATSNDGFATWTVAVPVSRGSNILTVELTDGEGNIHDNLDSIAVQNELFTPAIATLAVDVRHDRLLVLDRVRRAVVSIDRNNGERALFSGEGVPDANNALVSPRAIVVDDNNNRALVLDTDSLVAVDLTTGARTILSDANTPNSDNPIGSLAVNMALDSVNNRVLITNIDSNPFGTISNPSLQYESEILAVDLTTGLRSVLSDVTTPNDDLPFNRPGMIGVDVNQNRAVVVDSAAAPMDDSLLLSVSLLDGQRELFSGLGVPNNLNSLRSPTGLAVDQQNNRALLLEFDLSVLEVDLNSGSRSILVAASTPTIGFVASFGSISTPNGIALDERAERLYTVRTSGALVETIDLSNGDREALTTLSHIPNADNTFLFPGAIAYDEKNSRSLVVDFNNRILAVDPADGARTVVYEEEPEPGSFGFVSGVSDMDLGANSNRVYLMERHSDVVNLSDPDFFFPVSSLVALDLATNTREVISVGGDSQALSFQVPTALAVDEGSGFVYVLDQQGVLRVNIDNGDRELWVEAPTVSGSVKPFGDRFTGLTIDLDQNRLLATNVSRDLIAIDLDSQTQTLISDGGFIGIPVSIALNHLPLLLDSSRNRVLLTNVREIEAIDLQTGGRTVLSGSNSEITETPLLSPQGLALDTDNDRILTVDNFMQAVYAVDANNGNRAVHSR